MKASPDDPVPALELAEIAFGSGEVADALTALAEAARRANTDRSKERVDVRARVHADAVGFAERLTVRRKLDFETLRVAAALCRRFRDCAEDAHGVPLSIR